MNPRTMIGIPADRCLRPLFESLRGLFELLPDTPAALAQRLEKRGLSAAFLSPIDFARNASEYMIVPGAALSSRTGNESIVVHFRQGARTLKTLAVHASSATDIILAKILLAERFDLRPQLVPVAGDLEAMLVRADAALLTGEMAFRSAGRHAGVLDLIEEWIGVTGLPYVHGFWCGRETSLTGEESQALGELCAGSGDPAGGAGEDPYLSLFSYDLSEDVQEGIREFLRYSYYHGILQDVPDLRFFGSPDAFPPDLPPLN